MINILFIALEFPPQAQTGVYRSLKFVKYLPEFGINPIVLTLNLFGSTLKDKTKFNMNLQNEIPANINIYQLTLKDITKNYSTRLRTFITIYFSIYDGFYNAIKNNLDETISQIFLKHKPKLIYVSLPPFSSAKIAIRIKKKYKIPLIVDMRDGWSKWCVGPYGSWFHYILTHYAEYRLFKNADRIITVSDELKNIFQKTHKKLDKNKFVVIPNGYDFDFSVFDYDEKLSRNDEKFIICYIGRFYYAPHSRKMMFTPWWQKRGHRKLQYSPVKEDWLYRSPYFFLRSLKFLLSNNPELKQKVFFSYAGELEDWLIDMIKEFGLEQNFISYGFLNQAELLNTLKNCNAFLATSVKVIGGEDYALASKTFDYVKFNKPILGFVTEGTQKKFLINSGLGIICNPDDEIQGAEAINNLIKGKISIKRNDEYLQKFNRKYLTESLANIAREII